MSFHLWILGLIATIFVLWALNELYCYFKPQHDSRNHRRKWPREGHGRTFFAPLDKWPKGD